MDNTNFNDTADANDGRKKIRTEKQIASTAKMQKARKEKLSLTSTATPESIAVADVWYSNHELAKDKRRKNKMQEIDSLISAKLDSYHVKLMDEFQKPICGFLESFIGDNYEEDDESPQNKKIKTSRKETDRAESTPRLRAEPERRTIDFSSFF